MINRFLVHAARWWTAQWTADSFEKFEDVIDLELGDSASREFLTRTSSSVIRYHWASRMICKEIGNQIQQDPGYRAVFPEFTAANIDRCLNLCWQDGQLAVAMTPWTDPATPFAQHVALKAGALADRPFPEIALSTEMDKRPWIAFADGIAPIALGSVAFAMDRALLAAVDDRLLAHRDHRSTPVLDKGELYERVAQACINNALATLTGPQPSRPLTIRIPGENRPDIDCAGIGHTVEFIGEVKAMAAPLRINSAASAFEEQISKVISQLRKRLDAIDSNTPILDGNKNAHFGSRQTVGLGVVLNTYSGSLTTPSMLNLLPSVVVSDRIAVADLHAWILVLSAMDSYDDIRAYFRFRAQLLDMDVSVIDECDIALTYFRPDRDKYLMRCQQTREEAIDSDPYLILPAMYIDGATASACPRPTDPRTWRRQFYNSAQEVPRFGG
ncbi:hypothetical protein CRM89_28630 [Nocardia sp. FDAARGOS_372]|nr:hypothetical protein CRM89_28630 [Nocardia sp. FDAARGOS_372]